MALPKIATPTYETELISTKKKIKFRPFLVKEQKLFLMASQSDDPKEVVNVIKQVLKNCILDSDVDVETLPTFDLEHIFLQIRARSVSEVVSLRYTCNNDVVDEQSETKTMKKCGGAVKIDVNLLEIKPEMEEKHNKKIEITPELGIVMKYPTFEIMEKLDIQSQADLLKIIVACIDYIYDKEQIYYAKDSTKQELEEFVENLTQEDMQKIQNFFTTMPKLKKTLNFKCGKCGYSENMEIEGLQSFFE